MSDDWTWRFGCVVGWGECFFQTRNESGMAVEIRRLTLALARPDGRLQLIKTPFWVRVDQGEGFVTTNRSHIVASIAAEEGFITDLARFWSSIPIARGNGGIQIP